MKFKIIFIAEFLGGSLNKMLKLKIKYRNQKGVTMLELAVVLAVTSFISINIFAAVNQSNKERAHQSTLAQLKIIEEKILDYAKAHGHLPCPAIPNAKYDTNFSSFSAGDTFGREARQADKSCSILYSGQDHFGVAPVLDLNLPKNIAIDGWNNRILYIVDENLVTAAGYSANPATIQINNLNEDLITNEAAFALVSFGEDKRGSWDINSSLSTSRNVSLYSATGCSNDFADFNQVGIDTKELMSAFRIINKDGCNAFNDIVLYKTKQYIDAR